VVDDLQDAAESLAALVVTLGHDATSVTDPREAVAVAQAFKPALVLLDIGMPHINGYELAPMLRKGLLPAEVRIVAVTAWGSQQDREHSRAAGFDAHLLKPVGVELLQAAIRQLLPE
jgi:CheY-like chemotaxis protein